MGETSIEEDEVTAHYVLDASGRPRRMGESDPPPLEQEPPPEPHAPPAPPPPPRLWQPRDMIGVTLAGRYCIEQLIGLGGMGAVFRAQHVVIHKPVAVKVLNPTYSASEVDLERFLREARAASQIRHENVIDITDFGYTEAGQAFLVMEYLEGHDLGILIEQEGRVDWRRVVPITLQICAALRAAHAQGIIHRDMKPDNCILVPREDGREQIKVLDFGIAKLLDERREKGLTGEALIGTPEYVAPELVRGKEPDPRVDIYALGVVVYTLLTGELPFQGVSYMETLHKHLSEPLVPPRARAPDAEIPPELEAVVVRALAKDPKDRFQRIEELSAALLSFAPEFALGIGSPTGREFQGRDTLGPLAAVGPRRTRPRALAIGLGLGAALVLLIALLAWPDDQVDEPARPTEEIAAPAEPPPDPPPVAPTPAVEGTTAAEAATEVDDTAGDETTSDAGEPGEDRDRALPRALSRARFLKAVSRARASVRQRCRDKGLPGMKVDVKVTIAASGAVRGVTPVGTRAGSSLGVCVVEAVRKLKFDPAQRGSTHRASFEL